MASPAIRIDVKRPIDLGDAAFVRQPQADYPWMLAAAPVTAGRISLLELTLVSRDADCQTVLSDPRFVRNRARARGNRGGRPLPIAMPRSVAALARSMIHEDDPEHRRLRKLVNQAFTAGAIARLEDRVEAHSLELLDGLAAAVGRTDAEDFDVLEAYARPIPTRVIAERVGLAVELTKRPRSGTFVGSRDRARLDKRAMT